MSISARLNAVIDRAIAERRIVGAVVIVSLEGEEIFRRAAGHADREAGIPMRDDTIFRLASVTKPLVAATALALVDWGSLELETPVTDILPWFTPRLADGRRPVITIHHLLTHTAGLTYNAEAFARAGVSGGLENIDLSLEENIRRLDTVPLGYVPGLKWEYSMATDVLGAVVAKVASTTLGEAVAQHITGRLGMADTRFGVADPTRLAVPYGNISGGSERMRPVHAMPDLWGGVTVFHPGRIFNPRAFQSGGAGMAGTAPDFMRFLDALVLGGDPILSRRMTLTALTNRIGDVVRDGAPGEGFSYLGALIRNPKAAGLSCSPGTNRWGGIYGINWFLDPVENLALAAFTNTALEGSDGPFRNELLAAVYKRD